MIRKFFYLYGTVVFAVVLILASISILKKSTKPTVVSKTAIEAPRVEPPEIEAPEVKAPEAVKEEAPLAPEKGYEFHKGMMFVAWTENGYNNINSVKSMEQMATLGVEWAGLVTTWYQEQYNSTQIYPLKDKTPSDDSLIFALRQLHELKFKLMLKPHLDLVKGDGKWRGDIDSATADDWQTWFDNYTSFILHYANIAAQEKVELFCIGTELTQATLSQPQRWIELIKKVRQVYNGRLTYAANWHGEFNQIKFWDALDYAGVDPYFPLVCTLNPKVEELKSVWGDWLKEIETWQKEINKPVIFTEIGYKSSKDAVDEPWQHTPTGDLDLGIQRNCYQALLETFWDKPWFYGAYWWYWGVHPKMGGESNRDFTPQNKPAQEIIKEWYHKPVSQKLYS